MGIDEIGNSTPTVFLGLFHLLCGVNLCGVIGLLFIVIGCVFCKEEVLFSTFNICSLHLCRVIFLMGFEEEKWIQILKRIQPGYFSSLNLEF